jgi:peptidoglycan/LPS O-acetylase OafA/YrhL
MSERLTATPADKLLGLEALRFVAAGSVLVWHYPHFARAGDMPAAVVKVQLPFYGLLFPFYDTGSFGVMVFWAISGFIFSWKYRDAISSRAIGAWAFFVLRLSRLYPLHFVTLLMVASLQPIYHHLQGRFFVYSNNDLENFVLQLFLASEWSMTSTSSFNGPIWSVSNEVLAYLVFFLTLRFVTKSLLLNVIVVIACTTQSAPVASCLTFFYTGTLAAIGRHAVAGKPFRLPIEAAAWCTMAAIAIFLGMSGAQTAMPYWMVLVSALVLLFCLSGNLPIPPSWQRPLQVAGSMTYASYLLQFPIQLLIVIAFAVAGRPVPLYDDLFFVGFVGTTLLASFFTYRYFEAPAQKLIRGSLLTNRLWLREKAVATP